MNIKVVACAVITVAAALIGGSKANAAVIIEDTIIGCTEVTCIVWRCTTIAGETSCGTVTVPKSDFPEFPKER
jgi:hypothetical protein